MKDTPPPAQPPAPDHFACEDGARFAGKHLIVDVVGGTGLDDEPRIRTALRDAALACNATILHLHTHRFTPQGITGVAVLAESHISVHTWPEVAYAAFDIFMCGDATPERALPVLAEAFETNDIRVRTLRRGEAVI